MTNEENANAANERRIVIFDTTLRDGAQSPGASMNLHEKLQVAQALVELGVDVECLPGATAFVPALVDSGFGCESFVFAGFLPQKKGRQKRLAALAALDMTTIFYESPYRVMKLLSEISEHFGADRRVSISREISKIHEETLRGTPAELLDAFVAKPPKGEFVVIIDKTPNSKDDKDSTDCDDIE